MTEYVYRPSWTKGGKRVPARSWYGAYTVRRGDRARRVCLHTPDKLVAVKRLREIVVEKQREAEGLIAPTAERVASALPVVSLIGHYTAALTGLGRVPRHVKGTTARLVRMAREIGWKRLADIRPDTFTTWLSALKLSAKSKKEYQVSAVAFLNWLVRTEQLPRNPLARLESVETRGKQVRASRSLRSDEIERLLATCGDRRPLYLAMLYTGMRRGEAKTLVWSDVRDLHTERPYLLLRVESTKGKAKRAIPLHPALSAALRAMPGAREGLVFSPFPRWETMRADFTAAKIEHRDDLGRVAHFHSFRKSFQTLGVNAGINQRSAQEMLGHSDPSLTAGVYTDVASLELHTEVSKLPWFGADVVIAAQNSLGEPKSRKLKEVLSELINLAQVAVESSEAEAETAGNIGARDRDRTCTPCGKGF